MILNLTEVRQTLTLILMSMTLASCNLDNKGGLEGKIQTLELTYIAWGCACANWATKEDLQKYSGNLGDSLAKRCVFIEPANQTLELPDTLGYSNDIIRFTGQFYLEKGLPKDYQSSENTEKVRVLRYTGYEVVRSNYRESQDLINTNE